MANSTIDPSRKAEKATGEAGDGKELPAVRARFLLDADGWQLLEFSKMETHLTPAQLAQHLGVSRLTIYRMAAAKKIPSIRLSSRALRFNPRAVMTALSRNQREVSEDDHR